MIATYIVLHVGALNKRGAFEEIDAIELAFREASNPVDCDNINDCMNSYYDDDINYAELRVECNTVTHAGFLIGTFKKIKLKDKGHKWILAD
jgi:hypothetical protein